MEILFFAIGCLGLFFALISFIFGEFLHTDHIDSFIGDHLPFGHDVDVGGHDMGVGHDIDASHHVGFSKILNTGAFLGALSGFGFVAALVMSYYDQSAMISSLWGLLGGFVLGGLMGGFWLLLRKSEGTVGYDVNSLIGRDAMVEDRIYPNGYGKVKLVAEGIPTWYSARASDGKEIDRGSSVKVEKVVGSTLYVTKKE